MEHIKVQGTMYVYTDMHITFLSSEICIITTNIQENCMGMIFQEEIYRGNV